MSVPWWTRLRNRAGVFLAGAGFPGAFCCFFFLLLLLNLSYLWNPPHWDEIIGLHNQALFLAKHHFSFAELWAPEQHSFEGSNVYRFGLLPVMYGILYSLFSPQTVHLIGHIFNIACIAGAGTILFQILKRNSFSPPLALLWTLAAFSEPVISGRIAALGQECALIFCIMLALWFGFRKRWFLALGIVFFAGFIKASAVVLSLAFLLALLIRILWCRKEWRSLLLPLVGGVICFLIQFWMLQHNVDISAGGVHSPGTPVRDGGGSLLFFLLRKFYFHYELYFPVLYSIILLGGILFCVNWFRRRDFQSEERMFQLFVLLTVLGYFGAYLVAKIALPRYMAAASIPASLLLAQNLGRFRRAGAFLLIFAGLFGPIFYQELPFGIRRSGEYLERSREYLRDIDSNRYLCTFLEEYRDFPIVVSWPLAQMLTMPEMGYVKKPFPQVYSGRVPFYAPVRKLEKTADEMPADTIYVYHENDFENTEMSGPSLLPDRDDIALFRDTTLGGLVIVYRRAQ